VIALIEYLIVVMSSGRFLGLLEAFPPAALTMFQHLIHLVRLSTERTRDLSTLGANNLVDLDLIRLTQPSEGFDRGANEAVLEQIQVPGDIASRVSTTRETVARIMNDLARKGIVKRSKKFLIIHDLGKLERLVGDG
jgi:CRP-like cAMP-binding protein